MRNASVARKTNETQVEVEINLDGTGQADIHTGIGFLDHMLDQIARHGGFDLTIKTQGDLHIDMHHSCEDTAITLGQAMAKALGDKRGIYRYGEASVPMDEALTRVALDFSGRPFLVFRTSFSAAKIGDFDTELVREFFQGFAATAGITLHVETFYGVNNHHIAESCFKALARALKRAVSIDPALHGRIPSTKGTL